MKPTKIWVTYSMLLMVFLLGACSELTRSDRPAEKTWWLTPYMGISPGIAEEDALSVAVTVAAVPGLDTDRILTLSSDSELNQYSGARWADNLPDLVASLTRRSLQALGRFKVIGSDHDMINEDCELWLEVHEFYAKLGTSGQGREIRVAIDGNFRCHEDTLSQISLEALIPIEGNRMSAIVGAFQRGINKILAELPNQMGKIADS
jgi:ABC-type uncharacterized transport system auxiliary subunit